MAFDDILLDAKKLVKFISPAAWGQGFENGRGAGISLDRVIECMIDAKVKPASNEGYVQVPPGRILRDLVELTASEEPLCKNGADIRSRLADIREINVRHFSHGERVLLETLGNLVDDVQRLKFYFVFQDDLDRLLQLAAME